MYIGIESFYKKKEKNKKKIKNYFRIISDKILMKNKRKKNKLNSFERKHLRSLIKSSQIINN